MATENKASFTGNVERAIALSKWEELSHITAEKPVRVGGHDGADLYTVKVGIFVDRAFPTKAGNVTTAVVMVPLDGGKVFDFDGGKLKFDGIPPFIYGGRGISHVFTVLDDDGDVMKRHTTRRSSTAEIQELKKQLDTIMALLAKK
jgi:hypothetical protein